MKPITYTTAEHRLSPGLCAKIDDLNDRVNDLEQERESFAMALTTGLTMLGAWERPTEGTVRRWMSGLRCTLWGRGYDLFQEESREALVVHIMALLDELEGVRGA